MAAGHDARRLLERDEVAGPACPLDTRMYRNPGPRERAPVVDDRVADDSLAHADRSRAIEGEAPERERRREDDRPPRPPRDEALGDRLGEVACHEVIDAHGQMRAVVLEGAHADHRERAVSVERVDAGAESSSRRSTLIGAARAVPGHPTGRIRSRPSMAALPTSSATAAAGPGSPVRSSPCAASRAARKSVLARRGWPGSRDARQEAALPPGGASARGWRRPSWHGADRGRASSSRPGGRSAAARPRTKIAQPVPARRLTSQVSSPQQRGKATMLESRRIVA